MFNRQPALIGMIHIGALPGTPRSADSIAALAERAAGEARLYADAGFDAVMIENMHDAPYLNGAVGPEIVAGITAVGLAVRAACSMPLGVQVLAGANCEAVAVAHACGAEFVRVENFVFAHVADEGLMPTASAGPLLRYRRQIGADRVRVLADIRKKHASHTITSDLSITELAEGAMFSGADGVIITGSATGRPAAVEDVAAARKAIPGIVCVGSGVTPDTLPELWPHVDALIVGSFVKRDGFWSNEPDPKRLQALVEAASRLRRAK
ncbi:MAG: BtpA/SgcQ family protein [Phycisphaerales bacterium]|nr:BtpA/SgcQ family protein [Phycisphaerales bacterium]